MDNQSFLNIPIGLGPLVTQESAGFYTLIGVVSWGFGCADVSFMIEMKLLLISLISGSSSWCVC